MHPLQHPVQRQATISNNIARAAGFPGSTFKNSSKALQAGNVELENTIDVEIMCKIHRGF